MTIGTASTNTAGSMPLNMNTRCAKPTNTWFALQARDNSLKVNLSTTLKRALEVELRLNKRQEWLTENKQAIQNCNKLADPSGLFSGKHRGF